MNSTHRGRLAPALILVSSIGAGGPAAAAVWGFDDQLFHRGTFGVEGDPVDHEHFGEALALGDFDGDGFFDLVVGVPDAEVSGSFRAGQIQVFHGSATGLNLLGDALFDQDSPGIFGFAEPDDGFGQRLAVGDFNGDGRDDLAIGTPIEDVGSVVAAGAVWILPGSPEGLTATGSLVIDQSIAGVPGTEGSSDLFGDALTVGDFDGDGVDELAIGVPQERDGCTGTFGARGVVLVVRRPLSVSSRTFQTIDNLFLQETLGCADQLGRALAAGDFDDDGFDDLAIGAPGATVAAQQAAGRVWILQGSASGIAASPLRTVSQVGLADAPEPLDQFGAVLAAADFDGDGFDDLAIGVPNEDLPAPARVDSGVVHALYGGPLSIGVTGEQLFIAGQGELAGAADAGDRFGAALAAADLDGDARAELAIGVAHDEPVPGVPGGAFHVLPGSDAGLDPAGDRLLSLGSTGIAGADAEFAELGGAIAAAPAGAGGRATLAVGIPSYETSGQIIAGAVLALPGLLFAADFDEPGDGTLEWSSATP